MIDEVLEVLAIRLVIVEREWGFEIEEYFARRSCYTGVSNQLLLWQEFLSNRRNDALRCCYS